MFTQSNLSLTSANITCFELCFILYLPEARISGLRVQQSGDDRTTVFILD